MVRLGTVSTCVGCLGLVRWTIVSCELWDLLKRPHNRLTSEREVSLNREVRGGIRAGRGVWMQGEQRSPGCVGRFANLWLVQKGDTLRVRF